MKTFSQPALWSAKKFAARYGLNAQEGDFFVDANGLLNVPDTFPDNPPIFDLPNPAPIPVRQLIALLPHDATDVTFVAKLKAILMALARL